MSDHDCAQTIIGKLINEVSYYYVNDNLDVSDSIEPIFFPLINPNIIGFGAIILLLSNFVSKKLV